MKTFLFLSTLLTTMIFVENGRKGEDATNYHIRVIASDEKYQKIIDNEFKKLEDLALRSTKVHYNENQEAKYDCEIQIIFKGLSIKDREYSQNKHFSKEIREEQPLDDNEVGSAFYSKTVRGYVHQRIKERKLIWDIIFTKEFASNNCGCKEDSYTETIISKSIDNSITGDERAISKKYKESIGQPLSSRLELEMEAIANVYSKLAYQLKKND